MKDDYVIEKRFNQFLEKGEPPLDYGRQLLNGDLNKKRVIAILNGEIVPPYEVEIQPSSICNLACGHCFGREYERLPNKLHIRDFITLADRIDDFQENGFKVEAVKFCGTTGEPLMNPSTMYAIRLFKNRGKKVMLFTNGLALDTPLGNGGEKYYNVVGECDKLNLSLDAGSEKVFFDLKGKPGFVKIIKSLEEIANIRDKENNDLDVRVSYVIGEKNYNDIVNATNLVKGAGANEIIFRIDFTGSAKAVELFEEITENINKAKEYKSDYFKVIANYSDDEVLNGSYSYTPAERKCFNHNFWACVGPDGGLYACGHRTYGGVKSYGNLLENSFRDIWTSEERQKAIKELPDYRCKNCSPSSKYRNDFMTFLSGLTKEKREELILNANNLK